MSAAESPPSSAEFDAHARAYEDELMQGLSLTGESKDYFAEGRVRWLRRRLAERGEKPASCLDFGCGTGGSRGWLMNEFPINEYVGFDPSVESLKAAVASSGELAGVSWASEAAALPLGSVDLAFTNGVFHHIPPEERAAAMKMVFSALRPGGWFAFWENNRWNPVVHYMMGKVPFDRDARMLFPHQARALLRQAGFEVALTDSLFIFPAALKSLRCLEPGLCKLPLGGQYLVLARKPEEVISP